MTVGDQVSIEFSLRGREWRSPSGEVKYFNSLDVWRLEPARAGSRPRRNSQNGDFATGTNRGMDAREVPPPREYDGPPGSRADDDIPF
jgi:single-stranded DNA-binding protein